MLVTFTCLFTISPFKMSLCGLWLVLKRWCNPSSYWEEVMQTKFILSTREPPSLSRQREIIDKNSSSFARNGLVDHCAPWSGRDDMFGRLREPATRTFSTLRITCRSIAQSPHGAISGPARWASWDMDSLLYSNTAGTCRASLPPPLLRQGDAFTRRWTLSTMQR